MPDPLTSGALAMPVYYIPHGGGPCFFMDWNPPHEWDRMAAFLRGLPSALPRAPKAILVISGHWESAQFEVTSSPKPALIYDYSGFPASTYALRYDAPGDPPLAREICELLQAGSISSKEDALRGWDHGVFIPLKVAFPNADIPLVQLSLKTGLDPAEHLAAGRALARLRDEDVLIVGSGMSFHNMRGFGNPAFQTVSEEFDAWLTGTVALSPKERDLGLEHWADAPKARLSHPREEHLLPLMVAAGAAKQSQGQRVFSDRVMQTRVSAYRFG